MVKFGIWGAGHIAHAMAGTIVQMKDVQMYAVASRNLEKAETYKEQYGMEKAKRTNPYHNAIVFAKVKVM